MHAPSSKAIRRGLILLALSVLAAVLPTLALSGSRDSSAVAANVTIDLCADEGTLALPGPTTVAIWGFSSNVAATCQPATLPGPVLAVNEGDVVTVNLTNNLSEPVSIVFPGQGLIPNAVVVAPAATDTYAFTASAPGTYLYEAGTNTATQVPMGLYGALIVRPAGLPNQAYSDAATAFDVEEVLVLSEIDPNLNASPNSFNLVGDPTVFTDGYHPTYFLINGEAYPDTDVLDAAAGDSVLLRYLNAGVSHDTMTLLGKHQRVIAKDAFATADPFDVVAETIPAGSTLDTIVTLTGLSAGATLPLYNRQLNVTNNGTYPGGMLTFLAVQ